MQVLNLLPTVLLSQINIIIRQEFASNCYTLHAITNCAWSDEILIRMNEMLPLRIASPSNDKDYNEHILSSCILYLSGTIDLQMLLQLPFHSNLIIIHSDLAAYLNSTNIIRELFQQKLLKSKFIYINRTNFILTQDERLKAYKWSPNFRNEIFRISLFPYEPLAKYSRDLGFYGGIEKHILDAIIDGWDVVYKPHGLNSWERIYDDIIRRKSDIGLCGFWLDGVHSEQVDISNYYLEGCSTFIVPKPKLLSPDVLYILRSFQANVYILIVIVMVFVACAMRVLARKQTIATYLLIVYQIFMNASMHRISMKIPIKIVIASWCLTTILINVFFAAGLTRTMSFPSYTRPVNTMKDMFEQNVQWIMRSPSIYTLINNSPNYYVRHLPDLIAGSKSTGSSNADYSQFAGPVNIVMNYVDIPGNQIRTYANSAKILKECVSSNYFAFPIRKGSPYKKLFDYKINQIVEGGLVQVWSDMVYYENYNETKWIPLLYKLYPDESNNIIILGLAHIECAFYILFVGYVCSTAVFIKELLF